MTIDQWPIIPTGTKWPRLRPAGDTRAATITVMGLLTSVVFSILWTSWAIAQVVELPGAYYGRTNLSARESLGGAANFVRTHGNVFEPIAQLRKDDRIARLARSVGRLDILMPGENGGTLMTCTGSLISDKYVLTNHHCAFPRDKEAERMSLLFDYLDQTGEGTHRVDIDPRPVEHNRVLDYAILRLRAEIPDGIEPLRLVARVVRPRDRLRMIHHPGGQPKVMTQFRCKASPLNQPGNRSVRHTCDTLPGSSGALVLNHDENVAVGLHHTGGLSEHDPNSFNTATSVQALADHSSLVRRLTRTEERLVGPNPNDEGDQPPNLLERKNAPDVELTPDPAPKSRLNEIINP